MSDFPNNEQREQLLMAYLDNELDPEECARAERMLQECPDDAQLLRQWREHGEAIRELPRFSLDEGFAARVWAEIEGAAGQQLSNPVETCDRVDAGSELNRSSRVGLASIAILAALLVLTLFVFPEMIDSNVAELPPPTSGAGGVVNPADTEYELPASEDGNQMRRQPVIGSLNRRLPGERSDGKPVHPIELLSAAGPNVEQVLWIENKSLAELETAFARHSIRIIDAEGDLNHQVHLVPQSSGGIEALYVVSTAARMKQAIAEISGEPTCSIKAFPLPDGLSDTMRLSPEKAVIENASARQIKPLDLSQTGTDVSEIASLDRWFGLVGDEDETRVIQFLLLVKPSPKSAATNADGLSLPASTDK